MEKVAYFSPYFWPEQIGSAPYCTDVANYINGSGAKLSVFAFRPAYPRIDLFPEWADGGRDEETFNGMKIMRTAVVGRGSGGFKERIRNDFTFLWNALRTSFRPETESVSHVVAYVPGVLCALGGAIVAWRRKAKLIIVVHDIESGLARSLGMLSNPLALGALQFLERFVLNRADQVIVLTDGMADELRGLGCRRPISVLPIWAQTHARTAVRQTGSIKIGYSGNFGKKQNLDQLLPLIDRIASTRPDLSVVLRGDGSEKPRFEDHVRTLGAKNVAFFPLVPEEQLAEALADIDIHLVPQALNVANYALPSKLISVMSVGRPFICIAEKDSPLDVIARESGAGLCIYPGDDDALFEAVTTLVADRERIQAMGDRGRDYVARNMNRDDILRAYWNLITGK